MSLNLSSQPFVNSRPVRRLVFVLWCLGALLLAPVYALTSPAKSVSSGAVTQ